MTHYCTALTVEMSALELESPIHRTTMNSFIKVYFYATTFLFWYPKKGPLTAVKGEGATYQVFGMPYLLHWNGYHTQAVCVHYIKTY